MSSEVCEFEVCTLKSMYSRELEALSKSVKFMSMRIAVKWVTFLTLSSFFCLLGDLCHFVTVSVLLHGLHFQLLPLVKSEQIN